MMEPFNNNPNELLTFIHLFIFAVVVVPLVFWKIGEWLE